MKRLFDSRSTLWASALGLCLTAGLIFPMPPATATEELVKLTASDGTAAALFGNSVAVSGDTAVIGAPNPHVHPGAGAAYVFTRVGDTWIEQAKLTASDGAAGDRFGWSVAISGDTIVVSSLWDDVGINPDQGSAYVFTRTAGTWTEQAKLIASDGVRFGHFGFSVGVSGDVAVIGAARSLVEPVQEQVGLAPPGSAYVFARTGGTWTEQVKLTPSDGFVGDAFGGSVALDGDTVIVGASGGQGSAYVFALTGATWTQQKKLTASDGAAGDEFGFWVAVSGESVVVGAMGADVTSTNQGSAYVFTRTVGTWTQQKKLIASDGAEGDAFGRSVAVSGDTVVVGAQGDDVGPNNNNDQGSAYVFSRTGATWAEQTKLTAADGTEKDLFGVSVGMSGDTVVVGANFAEVGANPAQGAAYVWTDANTSTQQVSIDVKPGDDANRVRTSSNEALTVAVLTDPTFDATTVNPSTVCFGDNPPPGGTAAFAQPSGVEADCNESHRKGHVGDADGDGDLDMVVHFETGETGIDSGDTQARLTGKTTAGIPFEGSDSIRTVR